MLVGTTDYAFYDDAFVEVNSYTPSSTFLLQHGHFRFTKQKMQPEIMIKAINPIINEAI